MNCQMIPKAQVLNKSTATCVGLMSVFSMHFLMPTKACKLGISSATLMTFVRFLSSMDGFMLSKV